MPPTLDYCLINDRLAALERLLALRDKGILTADELEYEKAAILRLPNEELILRPGPARTDRGPSLLGRLFDWKVLASGIVAGLALAAFTRPEELTRLLNLVSA